MVADLPVFVTADGTDPADAARVAFGAFPETRDLPAAEVGIGPEPGPLPTDAPLETAGTLRVWRDHDVLVLDSGLGVSARSGPGGTIIGGRPQRASFAVALRMLLAPVLTHVLGLAGRSALHAAAVARPGAGVVLLGATGSGKSTVAYAASQAGWQMLADDLVVVRSDLTLIGVHRRPHVPSDVAGTAGPLTEGDRRGRVVPELRLDTGHHRATAVLVVGHSEGPSGTIRPLSPVTVAQLAFASFPVSYPPFARTALDLAGDIAGLPSYELLLPSEPAARLDFVAASLAQFDPTH